MIIKKELNEIENYLSDSSHYKGFCDSVYFPENEDDVRKIILEANNKKLRVTISGNGTGLTGGRVPKGGIVIATDKLNKIIEINKNEHFAIIQTGVILSDFQKEVEALGLFYPPDPTERNCFIGATVVNNSSGAKSFKYGSTRNFVIGVKIILPSGELLVIERDKIFSDNGILNLITVNGKTIQIKMPNYQIPSVKHAAGFFYKPNMDAIDLFIGSEGTLGFISEIKLKLIDLPNKVLSSVVFFDVELNALNFIEDARNKSYDKNQQIDALGLEFFDKGSLKLLKKAFPQIPDNAFAAVWFEQEIFISEEQITDLWIELIDKHNGDLNSSWFAANDVDREKFKNFRHLISAIVTEYTMQKGVRKIGTDTAVPNDKFFNYYFKCIDMVTQNNLNYVCYGHFGNSHFHLNMLPENQNEFQTALKLYDEICTLAIFLGGTISAEHGIGKLKRNYLVNMYGEKNILDMAIIKKTLDPNLILNIGNIIDEKYLEMV